MPLDVVLHGLVHAVLSFLSVDGFDIESARAKSREKSAPPRLLTRGMTIVFLPQ